jgi:phospholipid/cholesterol/gamma-HCH transport system substrate-binding protein
MKFERTEVRTGIFFVATFGLLLGVVLLLTAPGLFRSLKEFEVFFDNAGGLKPGASVNLGGRKIGQVLEIESPVPKVLRPTQHPDYEVLVKIQVDRNAKVYRDAVARMGANGLLAEMMIDFIQGNEESGLAQRGDTFIGERQPDVGSVAAKAIKTLEPVAAAAESTLKDLKVTISTLNAFFGQGSDLQASIANIRRVGENFAVLSNKDGALGIALENIRTMTEKLASEGGPLNQTLIKARDAMDQLSKDKALEKTLANIRAASARLESLLAGVQPKLTQTATNVEQLTDTLKRQPWRVIFPATKSYPEDAAPKATPKPTPTPRKAVRPKSNN